jgi:hypothetical protein
MSHLNTIGTGHVPAHYPKMKYASTGGAVMVHNATEERGLGAGWSDTDPDTDATEPENAAKPAKRSKGVKA